MTRETPLMKPPPMFYYSCLDLLLFPPVGPEPRFAPTDEDAAELAKLGIDAGETIGPSVPDLRLSWRWAD